MDIRRLASCFLDYKTHVKGAGEIIAKSKTALHREALIPFTAQSCAEWIANLHSNADPIHGFAKKAYFRLNRSRIKISRDIQRIVSATDACTKIGSQVFCIAK